MYLLILLGIATPSESSKFMFFSSYEPLTVLYWNHYFFQGMNYIAALLLLTIKNEEKVFWLMDSLINDILPGAWHLLYFFDSFNFHVAEKCMKTLGLSMIKSASAFKCFYIDWLVFTENILKTWMLTKMDMWVSVKCLCRLANHII